MPSVLYLAQGAGSVAGKFQLLANVLQSPPLVDARCSASAVQAVHHGPQLLNPGETLFPVRRRALLPARFTSWPTRCACRARCCPMRCGAWSYTCATGSLASRTGLASW